MSLKFGVVVANVSAETQHFWIHFKRVVKDSGLSYTKALEQAAVLWLDSRDQPWNKPVEAVPEENPFS